MTTDTFRRADHRPVPTSADKAEASPVALRAPSEAPASCCFPWDIAHSPARRRLSKEIVGRGSKEDGDALGSCIERIGDQFLDRFVRASVQTFGKQTNDPKAQPNINLFGFGAGSCKIRTVYHK